MYLCIKIVRPFPDGKERNSSHQINLTILNFIYNDRSQALVKNNKKCENKCNGSTTTTTTQKKIKQPMYALEAPDSQQFQFLLLHSHPRKQARTILLINKKSHQLRKTCTYYVSIKCYANTASSFLFA